jgi:hypothetical protein
MEQVYSSNGIPWIPQLKIYYGNRHIFFCIQTTVIWLGYPQNSITPRVSCKIQLHFHFWIHEKMISTIFIWPNNCCLDTKKNMSVPIVYFQLGYPRYSITGVYLFHLQFNPKMKMQLYFTWNPWGNGILWIPQLKIYYTKHQIQDNYLS